MRTADACVALFAGGCGMLAAVCFGMLGQWMLSLPCGVTGCQQFTKGVRILRTLERVG